MNLVVAPWLQPTNTLGAISAGAQAGLGLRAAAQREREAAAQEALARDRMAQEAAEAEQAMLYRNQSLMAQINNQLRDEAFAQRKFDAEGKQFEAKAILDKKNSDLLADYRKRMAQAREDEVKAKSAPKPFTTKTYHVGDSLVQEVAPGEIKKLYTVEGNNLPKVSGIPVTSDPMGPKVSLPVNDPRLNALLGTNASMLGTNWNRTIQPEPQFKIGQKVKQGGRTYQFDGKSWLELE